MAKHGQTAVSAAPSGGRKYNNGVCFEVKKIENVYRSQNTVLLQRRLIKKAKTYINTTEISLFDTGVGQEGIDESHIHTNTLENLCA